MSPADRLADAAPQDEPVLSGEEGEALSEPFPTQEALAAIAEAEAREIRRARMQAWRL